MRIARPIGAEPDTQPFIGLRKIHMGVCLKSRKSGYGHVFTIEFYTAQKRKWPTGAGSARFRSKLMRS